MENNIEKSQVIRISRRNESLQIKAGDHFKHLNKRWLLYSGNEERITMTEETFKIKYNSFEKPEH